jgi:hypothetical protein
LLTSVLRDGLALAGAPSLGNVNGVADLDRLRVAERLLLALEGLEYLFGHAAGFEAEIESHMLPGATAPQVRVAVGQG